MELDPAGIDIHGHAVPAQLLEDASRQPIAGVGVERSDEGWIVTFPARKPLRAIAGIMVDFDRERLGWLDDEEMGQQIIAPWLDIHGQELPADRGWDWVRALNDAMAQAVQEHPDRLHASATLHLADPKLAAQELERAVTQLGMRGCMLPTNLPNGSLATPALDALWEAAEDLQAPVTLHPPTVAPSGTLLAELPDFKGTFGRGIDTMLAGAELIVAGVFDRFPNLKMVLVHGGGFLPYQAGRFDRDFGRGAKGDHLERLPSEYIEAMFYDTVLLNGASIQLLLDLVGPDQVMIGSDYGAHPKERSGIALKAGLDEAGARQEARDAVLRGTADRLFFDRVAADS